jgi:hypothetical protein
MPLGLDGRTVTGLVKPHSPGSPLYNKNHPIADGLVFGAIPGGMHRQDVVSGNQPRNISTVANGTIHGPRRTALGSGFESKSTTAGYISWPITPQVLSIDNTNEFSFAVWYEVDTSTNWATLLSIPYRDSTWTNPFIALGLRRSNVSAFQDFSKATSSSSRVSITAGKYTATSGPLQMTVVTGHGGDVYFYINSDRGGLQTWSTTVIDMSQAVEVVMCNRSSTSNGEGYDGIVNAGFIWNRPLEHQEVQALYQDPYIFIRPERKLFLGGITGTQTLFSQNIAVSSDDAFEGVPALGVDIDSGSIPIGNNGTERLAGFRFNAVTIPKGATIVDAFIQFASNSAQSSTCDFEISGEDADNAVTFATSPDSNLSDRTQTTARVEWAPAAWGVYSTQGADEKTPDIKTIIQEIIDRASWASGNAIVILIAQDSGSGLREAISIDEGGDTEAVLSINFIATLVEQEGFRFRTDDGSESAATWRQAQDVDDTITKEINFRLRFLLNGTNDPDTDAYKIQYKKTSEGDSEYKDILPT